MKLEILIEVLQVLIYFNFLYLIKPQGLGLITILIIIELIGFFIILIGLIIGYILDDFTGNILGLIFIPLSGTESALGLLLLILYKPLRGNLNGPII